MRKHCTFVTIIMLMLVSCSREEVRKEIFVYANDFETGDYTGISGVYIGEYQGNKVMGNFNNRGFELNLPNLPEHKYIRLVFDLYIHDSWEGNSNQIEGSNAGPDAWFIEFDTALNLKSSERISFRTTFSNGICIPGFCLNQSYPEPFPFPSDAKEQAFSTDLPGLCLWNGDIGGTSMYKVDEWFRHDKTSTTISFFDKLIQPNSHSPVCDESWSLDNLSIRVF